MNGVKTVFMMRLIMVLFFLFALQMNGQEDTVTNAELLQEVLAVSLEPVYEQLPPGVSVSLDVRFPEFDWFISHRLTELLRANGYTVLANDLQNEAAYRIEAGVEHFSIQYTGSYRRSLFGGRMLERIARSTISFRMEGGGNQSVVRTDESVRSDIPYSMRNTVESPALPFTQAYLPAGSLVERYVGPAFIVAVTGAVIYLFFSVRS
jgi:hypothetical protein